MVHIDLWLNQTLEHVRKIWIEGHADPDGHTICAVLTRKQYELLAKRGKQSFLFVLPLPRGDKGGHLTMVSYVVVFFFRFFF